MAEWQKEFEKIKKILTLDLFLSHFDLKLEIIMATYVIVAVILHKHKDGSVKEIVHASRTLLSVEKNYSQTEKKGVGNNFCCKKIT